MTLLSPTSNNEQENKEKLVWLIEDISDIESENFIVKWWNPTPELGTDNSVNERQAIRDISRTFSEDTAPIIHPKSEIYELKNKKIKNSIFILNNNWVIETAKVRRGKLCIAFYTKDPLDEANKNEKWISIMNISPDFENELLTTLSELKTQYDIKQTNNRVKNNEEITQKLETEKSINKVEQEKKLWEILAVLQD